MTHARLTADDVVDVAERILDTDGISALSVRRLAAELSVSRQIVYTHFGGMRDVLEQLHLRSGHYLTESVRQLPSPVGTDDRLLSGANAYVSYARHRPAMFELTFGQPVPGYVPSTETTAALQSVFRVEIVGLIREWQDANGLTVETRATIDRARVYWSAIHGLVTLERAGHATETETDQLVEELTRTFIAGWRSNPIGVGDAQSQP